MPEFHKTNNMTDTGRLFQSGLIFFIYSLALAVAIQIYIVPKVLPQLNFGEGIATLDATGFNQIAKEKAEEIKTNGWGAWELRPQGLSPAGIASIFYKLWIPKPYSLLPFNALVHALSGCLVLWLLLHLFSWKSALFGSALFVVNPASMQWVAQIHRDGVFILGNLMVLSCLVQLWCWLKSGKVRTMTWGVILGVTGSCLVWIARPYWIQVLMITLILGLLIISIFYWATHVALNEKKHRIYYIIIFVLIVLVFQGWLVKQEAAGLNRLVQIPQDKINRLVQIPLDKIGIKREKAKLPLSQAKKDEIKRGYFGMKYWRNTKWVPNTIEGKLYQVSIVRNGALNSGGNTVVDTDIILNSTPAFVAYFPRALQLGFLSPLPELWQGEGSTPTMTIARKVMGVVTFIFYFCLLGACVGIYLFRKNPIIWLLLMFCFLGIMIFIYAYPNIGTFLRFRYGFYMLLIAFGVANITELTLKKYSKCSNQ